MKAERWHYFGIYRTKRMAQEDAKELKKKLAKRTRIEWNANRGHYRLYFIPK